MPIPRPARRFTSRASYAGTMTVLLIWLASCQPAADKDFDLGDRDKEAERDPYRGTCSAARARQACSFQVFQIKFPERFLA